jgi:hypothetical protein
MASSIDPRKGFRSGRLFAQQLTSFSCSALFVPIENTDGCERKGSDLK